MKDCEKKKFLGTSGKGVDGMALLWLPVAVIIVLTTLTITGCSKSANELDEPKKTIAEGPSAIELASIDDLLNQNKYDEARQKIDQLHKKYRASSEVYYRAITAYVLEIKWAVTLPGGSKERMGLVRKFVWDQDYLGLICETSAAYMEIFGPSDKHFKTIKALHDVAEVSLSVKGAPCKHRPMSEFDPQEFVSRLVPFADFVKKLESFTLEH